MYYPCSENKGADQLRGYREADLCLCFRLGKNPVFSRCGSFYENTSEIAYSILGHFAYEALHGSTHSCKNHKCLMRHLIKALIFQCVIKKKLIVNSNQICTHSSIGLLDKPYFVLEPVVIWIFCVFELFNITSLLRLFHSYKKELNSRWGKILDTMKTTKQKQTNLFWPVLEIIKCFRALL